MIESEKIVCLSKIQKLDSNRENCLLNLLASLEQLFSSLAVQCLAILAPTDEPILIEWQQL